MPCKECPHCEEIALNAERRRNAELKAMKAYVITISEKNEERDGQYCESRLVALAPDASGANALAQNAAWMWYDHNNHDYEAEECEDGSVDHGDVYSVFVRVVSVKEIPMVEFDALAKGLEHAGGSGDEETIQYLLKANPDWAAMEFEQLDLADTCAPEHMGDG
jgi:hypothetical protein